MVQAKRNGASQEKYTVSSLYLYDSAWPSGAYNNRESFICLKEQKHIQTSRSTKAKYALTCVLIKDHSTI